MSRKDSRQVPMVRPFWEEPENHEFDNLTVLICQYETKFITQLCLESLLRFYPTINILVVNGSPHDHDSTLYLRLMALQYKNIKIWERVGRNSHGETMDEALRNYISTRYVLLLDSDTIVMRGGFIEKMLKKFNQNIMLYAIGTLMLVSSKNDACGEPLNEDDIMRYAHPSCSIYDRNIYLTLKPFCDHGAPCVYNQKDALRNLYDIEYFPVDEYVLHLSGASWCKPKTIWANDYDVKLRPFLTFIVNSQTIFNELYKQIDNDFDIILASKEVDDHCVIHGKQDFQVNNMVFDLRFRVNGMYVCRVTKNIESIYDMFVRDAKRLVIENNLPNELVVGGLIIYERKYWQENICML